jgi:hypothetical protein
MLADILGCGLVGSVLFSRILAVSAISVLLK